MDVKALAAKIQKLAERGDPGERELALQKLEALKSKYNLSDSDILDTDKRVQHELRYVEKWQQRLISQIAWHVKKDDNITYSYTNHGKGRRSKVVVFYCTEAEFLEIEYLYSFYSDLYYKELDMFYAAFVNKHGIFGDSPNKDDNDNESQFSISEILKLKSFMSGMDDDSPLKAISYKD